MASNDEDLERVRASRVRSDVAPAFGALSRLMELTLSDSGRPSGGLQDASRWRPTIEVLDALRRGLCRRRHR